MKNILLLLHDDDGQEGRLQVALDVARALSGHLTCLGVVIPPVLVPEAYIAPGELDPFAEACKRAAANVSSVRKRLENEDVPWEIEEAYGAPADRLKEAADLADVIVVSVRGDRHESGQMRRIASDVAARSGRLVLAVPPGCTGLDLAGRALVAWDGSHESSQAVRAALPLLQMAGGVTVMQVSQPSGEFDADDAATYLSRHRIRANVVEETSTGPVADALLERARSSGANYLVMGAYGHSRIVEAVFGGVTVEMLRNSDIPVFLHH